MRTARSILTTPAPPRMQKASKESRLILSVTMPGSKRFTIFTVNIDNDGFKNSGFMRFCERLGTGEAFVKSASYLMHRDHFSEVRNFLLEHSRLLLQDDSGVPITRFDQARWQLRLFGHYSGPI